jgi:hypothetical protein
MPSLPPPSGARLLVLDEGGAWRPPRTDFAAEARAYVALQRAKHEALVLVVLLPKALADDDLGLLTRVLRFGGPEKAEPDGRWAEAAWIAVDQSAAWREVPDGEIAGYLRGAMLKEHKKLCVWYGDDGHLGALDRDDVDRRAAMRLRGRGANGGADDATRAWIRYQRVDLAGADVSAPPVDPPELLLRALDTVTRGERERTMLRLIAADGRPATEAAREAGLSRSDFRAFQARARAKLRVT